MQRVCRTFCILRITYIREMITIVGSTFLKFPVNNAHTAQIYRNLPVSIMNSSCCIAYNCSKRIIIFICCAVISGRNSLTSSLLHHIVIEKTSSATIRIVIIKRQHFPKVQESSTIQVIAIRRNNTISFWCKTVSAGTSCCSHGNRTVVRPQNTCIAGRKAANYSICATGKGYRYISQRVTVSDSS